MSELYRLIDVFKEKGAKDPEGLARHVLQKKASTMSLSQKARALGYKDGKDYLKMKEILGETNSSR